MIISAMERFIDEHEARSLNTARSYSIGLSRFREFLAEKGIDVEGPVDQLNLRMMRDFVTWLGRQTYQRGNAPERKLSMRSRHHYATGVNQFFRFLVIDGLLPDVTYGDYLATSERVNRATRYNDVPIEKKLPPDEVVDAVIEAAKERPDTSNLGVRRTRRVVLSWMRDKAIVLTLYCTGMRVGELSALKRGDLSYEDRGAWVHGKGDKTRFVRFSAEAWEAIMDYLEMRRDETLNGITTEYPVFCRHNMSTGDFRRLPLGRETVERMVRDLAKKAGVYKRFRLTPHKFRHHFATRFLRHTGNLALTQDVLGHANPMTTRIYAKTTKEEHIEAHDSLFGDG